MYCFCCFTLNFVNHLSKLCGPSSAVPPHGDTLHSQFILWQSDHCSNRLDANRIPVYALKMEAIKLMPRALFFPLLFIVAYLKFPYRSNCMIFQALKIMY